MTATAERDLASVFRSAFRLRRGEPEANDTQAYGDSCERNTVEGRNGITKRRYGLDPITMELRVTAEIYAALDLFAPNGVGADITGGKA